VLAALVVFGVDRLVHVVEIRLFMTAIGLLVILMFLPGGLAGRSAGLETSWPVGWPAPRMARRH